MAVLVPVLIVCALGGIFTLLHVVGASVRAGDSATGSEDLNPACGSCSLAGACHGLRFDDEKDISKENAAGERRASCGPSA
jgi:hypothetical protein